MLSNSDIYQNTEAGKGTVGGFFKFPNADNIYGISNNHVIANLNNCNVGDPVFDIAGNQVGSLTHWFNLQPNVVNFIDAALFECRQPFQTAWRINNNAVPKPLGFIEPKMGGHVYLMHSNNVARWGVISNPSINTTVNFTLGDNNYPFSKLIEISPTDGIPFSSTGNSGSIIMSSNHCIVGLLVGAETGGIKSYAVPFVNGILNYLPLIIP